MDDEMTVEQYLTRHNEGIMNGLRSHGLELMLKLRNEYETNAAQVRRQLSETLHEKPLVVTLKCVGGPHIGQRFRLEPTAKEDVFKVGRSTGRHFKEKGVSLYKDKEISTTHAKIELRHGQVFLVDVRSTNGSLLNG